MSGERAGETRPSTPRRSLRAFQEALRDLYELGLPRAPTRQIEACGQPLTAVRLFDPLIPDPRPDPAPSPGAQARALELLRSHLTPHQLWLFEECGYFYVRSPRVRVVPTLSVAGGIRLQEVYYGDYWRAAQGYIYALMDGWNTLKIGTDGRPRYVRQIAPMVSGVRRPVAGLPQGDALLGQKHLLEAMPLRFHETACTMLVGSSEPRLGAYQGLNTGRFLDGFLKECGASTSFYPQPSLRSV